MTTTAEIRMLAPADRCDRCPAAALVVAVLASGAELQMCGHHADEHGPALASSGAVLHDTRGTS